MKTVTILLYAVALPKIKIDVQNVAITFCLFLPMVMAIAWSVAPALTHFFL